MQVPRLGPRLRTLLLKFEAPVQLTDARLALETHRLAQRELCSSQLFAAVLQCALAAGNYCNHGTRLGQAAGFRLRSLRKLQASARAGWRLRGGVGFCNVNDGAAARACTQAPPGCQGVPRAACRRTCARWTGRPTCWGGSWRSSPLLASRRPRC